MAPCYGFVVVVFYWNFMFFSESLKKSEKKYKKNQEKKDAKCSETSKSGVFFCICTWKVPKNYFKNFGFQRDIEWNCASKHSILAAKKV